MPYITKTGKLIDETGKVVGTAPAGTTGAFEEGVAPNPKPEPIYSRANAGSNKQSTLTPQATGDDFFSRISKEKSTFESSLGSKPAEPDYNTILESKRAAAQASADMIAQQFNNTIANARREGEKRSAITDAVSRASGLSGSTFAGSRANETAEENLKVIQSYEKERDAKINDVMAGVSERASDEYIKERELFLKENSDRLDRVQKFNDNLRTRVTGEFAAIAASGTSYDEFKNKYPDQWNQLLQESGMSEDAVKAQFITNAPQGKIVGDPIIGNDGITYIMQKTDPKTGKIGFETTSVKLPAGTKSSTIKDVVNRKDGLYVINSDGTYKVIGGPEPVEKNVFTPEQKRTLLGTGLSEDKITYLETGISKYGMDEVLNKEKLTDAQKKAIKGSLGSSDTTQFLNKDYFKNLFTADQLKESAKEAGFTGGGFLGIGVGDKGINEYLDHLEKIVQQYREAGYTDQDILKMMK